MLPTYFMQLPRYTEWWFGWTSHMKLDFCMKCSSCKGCNILACNGTKLGVNFSNAFVDPIELLDDMMAIPTEMRTNDRCFIVTSDKSHPSFFQSLRSHLRAQHKTGQDDGSILNKVAFVEKTNVLKDIIPEQSKKLFTQMESSEGLTVVERKKIAKHFMHLSYNSSVDTIIPMEEADNITNFLSNCQVGYSDLSTVLMFTNHQHKFKKEIAEVISTSAMASPQGIPSSEVISHLSYLASFVESIHSVDLPAEEPVPIDHT